LERYPAEVAFLAPNTELIRVRALARKDQRIQAIRFQKCVIPSWPTNLDSKQTNRHAVTDMKSFITLGQGAAGIRLCATVRNILWGLYAVQEQAPPA
jgi:hypothetical protein